MRAIFLAILFTFSTAVSQAQWMRPAREVRAETNGWTYIPTSKTNVQLVINWLDAELGRVSLTGGFTVLPDTNNLQVLMEWIDDNWNTNAVPTLTFLADSYMKGTNIIGATFAGNQWTLPASGVPVSTSSWEVIDPASDNAQSVFDFLDAHLQRISSNLNVQSSAGAANAQHNNGFVGSHVYVVPPTGYEAVTSFVPGAASANTNVLRWSTTPGRLEFRRDGGYLLYATVNATNRAGVSFAYWYVYNGGGTLQRAFPVTTITTDEGEGAGLGVIAGVESGWYAELGLNDGPYTAGATTHLGSVYVDAFKLYNKD